MSIHSSDLPFLLLFLLLCAFFIRILASFAAFCLQHLLVVVFVNLRSLLGINAQLLDLLFLLRRGFPGNSSPSGLCYHASQLVEAGIEVL